VYAFSEKVGCGADDVEMACSSQGESGAISPIANPGTKTVLELHPDVPDSYIVAVDGDTTTGPYTVSFEQL
jgi:hypothetical protein